MNLLSDLFGQKFFTNTYSRLLCMWNNIWICLPLRRYIQQFIEIIKNIEFNNLWGIKLEVSKSDSL